MIVQNSSSSDKSDDLHRLTWLQVNLSLDLKTWRYKFDLTFKPCWTFPPCRLLCCSEECTFYSVRCFILFKNTTMNSRTFKETLCGLDSIKTKYAEISKGTDKPLITSGEGTKGWTSWKCWTHFKDKKLVCKLYKYNSWNVYFHDFRDGAQMKYSYIQGQVA